MRKKLTNNLGLKILSLFISFAVWLLVVNVDDPVISTTYSGVSVEFINAEALSGQGKTYEILNNTDVIDVTVTGKRSDVESISKENIRAVADLSNISYTGNVDIKLSTNKNYDRLDSLKSNIPSVSLNVEDLKTIHLQINVSVTGDPADGYIVGDISTNQNTVKISGPESVVSTIAKAETEVSVASRISDIKTTADIRLYDSKGKIVDSPYINTNIKNINISAAIIPIKAVAVEYEYSGNPESGYMVNGEPQSNYKSVYVAARQEVLDKVSKITVPGTAIDVEGLNETLKLNVDLNKYLPDGVVFVDKDFDGKVAVTVNIEKTIDKTFTIPVSSISVNNVPLGYEVVIETENEEGNNHVPSILVKTVGIESVENGLTASMINASIDMNELINSLNGEELASGVYRMEVKLELPDMVLPTEQHYVNVRVSKGE